MKSILGTKTLNTDGKVVKIMIRASSSEGYGLVNMAILTYFSNFMLNDLYQPHILVGYFQFFSLPII
jgi:hypothetical protein